ncbi:hypothetical protein BGX21_008288 [Mortierella sp. AD011]|nr:hypothetical protein BGX21_008288 [Mortierella sp. AD011]
MRLSIAFVASTIATVAVIAAPMNIKRGLSKSNIGVLNFALTLEHLEAAFYTLGLEKFDDEAFRSVGLLSSVREQFVHIKDHESTHVETLKAVIENAGGVPVPECKYNFPLTDIHSFVNIARALETTGVSAYLGAAANFNGNLLTGAASIATVEARQSSFLNELTGLEGAPYNFDTPLDARQVFTMASQFIESCPFNLGVEPFTQLKATLPDHGDKVMVSFEGEEHHKKTWCQFLFSDSVVVSPIEKCAIPSDAIGYFYLLITDTARPITFNNDRHIVAGPALLFNGDH